MMTSNWMQQIYVWGWLPGATIPVVIGVCAPRGNGAISFTYARSYRYNPDAIAIGPDLPLSSGTLFPEDGLDLAGTLRDALPDGWGQRVILNQLTGARGRTGDPGDLDLQTYMSQSDSNRFGALDFQASPTEYIPRGEPATLEDLHQAASILDQGLDLPKGLELAAAHGTSIGGARPKAQLIDAEGMHWIAKFESRSDNLPTVQAEFVALNLAARLGVDVTESRLVQSAGKHVLLVVRFDRGLDCRKQTVSMLTTLGLDEMTGRYASYPEFLDRLGGNSGQELFTRIALNIALGNTDDHARNHAAFWDGTALTLAPAYDIDPTARPGGYAANQAIAYGRDGQRQSSLAGLAKCANVYGLSTKQARSKINQVVQVIESDWDEMADLARLSSQQSAAIRRRSVLKELAVEGL